MLPQSLEERFITTQCIISFTSWADISCSIDVWSVFVFAKRVNRLNLSVSYSQIVALFVVYKFLPYVALFLSICVPRSHLSKNTCLSLSYYNFGSFCFGVYRTLCTNPAPSSCTFLSENCALPRSYFALDSQSPALLSLFQSYMKYWSMPWTHYTRAMSDFLGSKDSTYFLACHTGMLLFALKSKLKS